MKPPTKAKQSKQNGPAKPRKLLPRQERFCELIASGMSATDVWLAAGYKVTREVAATNASENLRKPQIAARIAELRKPQQGEIRKTKTEKLKRLEEIAWNKDSRPSDIIAALKVHNDMTGDNAPAKIEVETGPNTLESIAERAAAVASALDLNARLRAKGTSARATGLSRWPPPEPD